MNLGTETAIWIDFFFSCTRTHILSNNNTLGKDISKQINKRSTKITVTINIMHNPIFWRLIYFKALTYLHILQSNGHPDLNGTIHAHDQVGLVSKRGMR